MSFRLSRTVGSVVATAALAATVGWAQIERLDLAQMLAKADNAVLGKIVAKEVIRVDHPFDGPELYFTHLRIEGKSLYNGNAITVPVTFAGGFVRPGEGTWNSEAPTADDTQIGNQVVVFYKWTDNMGGDVAANALYAAHGGLYRVIEGRQAPIVLGRGDGYAIDKNITVADLSAAITGLALIAMKLTTKLSRLALPAIALAFAALMLVPTHAQGYVTLGFALPLNFRSVRVFNNFSDASANDNIASDPDWPGFKGAPLAIWKACSEWNSELHNLTGNGDPHQPGGLGSGGANYDASWQGKATSVGGPGDMTHSELSGSNGGVLAYTEGPSGGPGASGWRIRYYSGWIWEDGPSAIVSSGFKDIQGIACHECGHALGLGHSTVSGTTMYAAIFGDGVPQRSIESDDIAGVQAVYAPKDTAVKPKILSLDGPGPIITITGENFAATDNEVWFTQADPATSSAPIVVTGLVSNGTTIVVNVPVGVGPGDIQVKKGGVNDGKGLSNAFGIAPLLPGQCLVVNYCTAGLSSIFCAPTMTWSGNPSASTGSGFTLTCIGINGQRSSMIYYGVTGRQATAWGPLSSSFMCVKAPRQRTPAASSGGTNNSCDGTRSIDWNQYIATHSSALGVPFSAGNVVDAQCWYRDPLAPKTTNLSDGVEFIVCP